MSRILSKKVVEMALFGIKKIRFADFSTFFGFSLAFNHSLW